MIEAEHSVQIDAGIDGVWDYVQDIRKWAVLFPGCRECIVINANDSRWIIKVGAGGLVKTVNVLVRVDQWDGPERVNFTYKLEGEPVEGSGSYVATRTTANETAITLKVFVKGSGPMAPMWEAVSRPLLPQIAKSFAGKLKAEIEKTVSAPVLPAPIEAKTSSGVWALGAWIQKLWRGLFASTARNGRKHQE
jgi:carbon monoxide dehydrogenase subunit G